jgi:hypothetical protein
MALVIADRVRETTASTGTGTVTLGGPYSGFQAFSVLGNGNTTYYAIIDPTAGSWEVGIGTYTTSGNTLSRDIVLSSSNSDNLVNFGAGVKDAICTQPAERAVYLDTATNATIPNITTGALTASSDSAFTSTGALTISKGDTAARPTPTTGMLRYNTTTGEFEGYSGSSPSWKSVGGSAISNDTSTATDLFPLFASATTGTAQNIFTSNAQYLFKPSTGELSVKAPRASNGIVVNSATITSNYTIAVGDNGMSAGPVTVNSGITVTVSSGSVWAVI